MKILCVIDMQNDFIDGALGTKEAVSILGAVKDKIKKYKANGDLIVFTRDTHYENYMETAEGKKLPVAHCIEGTNGHQIHSSLNTHDCEIIDKPTFGSLKLADAIREIEDLESIELIGLCTDICVISNALLLKANFPEVKIVIDSSCCAGVTPESHENALKAMAMCQIEIT